MCNEMEIATISETEMLNSYGGHTPIQLRIGFQCWTKQIRPICGFLRNCIQMIKLGHFDKLLNYHVAAEFGKHEITEG